MIRKFLLAAGAALVLGGCATGYGYSGHGGYDAYGDYYHGGGSSYGYGGYGYGGYGYGVPYGGFGYGAYDRYYGGYGSPWYGGASWYGWPGYGYYPPYRPPHRPPHQGRPDRPDRPGMGIPQGPSQSQARPVIRDGWQTRPGRTITPTPGRLGAPAPVDRQPSRMRERPLQRPAPDPRASLRMPESRLQAGGAEAGGARLRAPAMRQRPDAMAMPAPAARQQAPARRAMPSRQVERSGTSAARPAVRAPARGASERRSTREVLTEAP
ncbi:hypothetical protein H5368_09775 [Luteimonas sp. MC1782]|uniref:hypothetical protein n=1 Tax=Luteimonas sp. MC1782 TaxID=2760305 RepID=UPI001603A916|nr:hypothetical protein [Luteimonas sp. MC1782]MBB1473322.1 hypothetical protein [Luteimonas sp. MC1782]